MRIFSRPRAVTRSSGPRVRPRPPSPWLLLAFVVLLALDLTLARSDRPLPDLALQVTRVVSQGADRVTAPLRRFWDVLAAQDELPVTASPDASALAEDVRAEHALVRLAALQRHYRLRSGFYIGRVSLLLATPDGNAIPDLEGLEVDVASASTSGYCMQARAVRGSGVVYSATPTGGVVPGTCSPVLY